MTFLPSLSTWFWPLLAAIPVGIILLYFLKLRRQPVTVPSTFLWAKTIEDLHVNSLLQRLRTTPLLLLQLLAIALAIMALLRPGYRDSLRADTKRVFLLDASASMAASDKEGVANRFDFARKLIGDEIDAMTDRDVAMLMMFSDRTDVLQSFTSDRRKLRDALSAAEVTNRTTNIQTALRAADGLSVQRSGEIFGEELEQNVAPETKTELILYSDGGFSAVNDFDSGRLNPRYVRIGESLATNLSIIAFSVQRSDAKIGEIEAFATIANLGTETASSDVSLQMNGELVDADEVNLGPGEETGISFQLQDSDLVRLQLTLDQADDLVVDNMAYAALAPPQTMAVLLVTPGNPPLELALTTGQAEKVCVLETVGPSYLKSDLYASRASAGTDKLIIFDRCSPESMPMTNTFFVGTTPPAGWQASEKKDQILLIDIDRTHPIMRYLDLFSLLVAEGQTLTAPRGSMDLLISETGPVLSLAPRDGFEDLVLGFEILSSTPDGGTAFNTDWQVQRSWPVFVFNAVRYLTGAFEVHARASHRPGAVVTLGTDRRQGELSIRSPDGRIDFVKPDATGRLQYSVGDRVGIYEIEDEKRIVDLFSVNLFDRQEATIPSAETVQLGFMPIASDQVTSLSRREYWRVLLLGMLGVLSLEWWYYGRRLGY